jgi:acyl CoA:acetate/3-ketoacid CoA transferase
MVPRILLEAGREQAVTWAIEQGAVGGMPLMGFAFGCASNADAFVPSPQQFIYFQAAVSTCRSCPSSRSTSRATSTSPSSARSRTSRRLRRFVDITAHGRKILFSGLFEAGAELELSDDAIRVTRPGKFAKMVDEVEHVHLLRPPCPRDGGRTILRHGALRDPPHRRRLLATEIMPAHRAGRDIIDASGGRVRIANDATLMPAALLRRRAGGARAVTVHLTVEGAVAETAARPTPPS